jgi:hypothetical protein
MDSGEAARQSMKLMHEFNLSMGEVEDTFIGIHRAVQTTGISTTKYLTLLDGISSQFDKFNKSLNYTVSLIAALGKGAKYTAEDIQGMMKGLMGEKKGIELSAFAYSRMGKEGMMGYAGGLQQKANASGRQLSELIGSDVSKLQAADILKKINPNDTSTMSLAQRYISERSQGDAAMGMAKKGNYLGLAAMNKIAGETPESQIVKNLALMNTAMKESGGKGSKGLMDWQRGNPQQEANIQKLLGSPLFAKLSEFLGTDTQSTFKYMTQAMSQFGEKFKTVATGGDEGTKTQKELGLSDVEVKKMQAEMRAHPGRGAEQTTVFQKWFEASGIAKLSTSISDQDRKNAEDIAKENVRYITGPLDYIQQALASLVANLKNLLEKITTFFSWSMNKTDADKLTEHKETGAAFSASPEAGKYQSWIAQLQQNVQQTPGTRENQGSVGRKHDTITKAQNILDALKSGAGTSAERQQWESTLKDLEPLAQGTENFTKFTTPPSEEMWNRNPLANALTSHSAAALGNMAKDRDTEVKVKAATGGGDIDQGPTLKPYMSVHDTPENRKRLLEEQRKKEAGKNPDPLAVSSAGAFGVGQIMAPNQNYAAKLAFGEGATFDAKRYATDTEYQKKLQAALFNQEMKKYKNYSRALSGYNAGDVATDAAIKKSKGLQGYNASSFLQFMPQETQDYAQGVLGAAFSEAGKTKQNTNTVIYQMFNVQAPRISKWGGTPPRVASEISPATPHTAG